MDRQTRLRSRIEKSPELLRAARQLATLALAQQDRSLGPREREELRRVLATAGAELGWSDTPASDADPTEECALDVVGLATLGVESLASDLAAERANKEAEVSQLGDVAEYARSLAADPNATYPVDITYRYTARDAYQGLVTKTAKSTVTNPHEALGAAGALEKSIDGRGKLTGLMVIDLDERRERLRAMTARLPDFVNSARTLLAEVIANLS